MRKTFVLLLLFSLWSGASLRAKSVSEAQWLWSQPQSDPPVTAYLRCEFSIDSPVKRAYFHTWADKRCEAFLNGKPLELHFWEPLRKYRGHVKGVGVEFSKLLKPGKNVLAFKLGRNKKGCFGLMLRGEIVLENGKVIPLASSGKQFKASGREAPGWNTAEFDSSGWLPAWEQGDVLSLPWSRFGSIARIYCTKEEYRNYLRESSRGYPEARLLREPADPECKIVYRGRIPGIRVNGRVIPPHTLSSLQINSIPAQDALIAQAAKAGIGIYCLGFVIDAFHTGLGTYDFEELDVGIRHILSIDPNAYFIISTGGTPPNAWLRKNPDELVGFAVKSDGRNPYDYFANPPAPSFASQAFRDETADMIRQLGNFVRKKTWGRRVIGVKVAYGASYDGMPWGCHCMPDTGKRMTEAFRRHLKVKYGTDQNLQKSWNDPRVTLGTAAVPDKEQRHGAGRYLKDPGDPRDRRVSDYYESYHKEFADYMISMGKAVKTFLPGRLAGSWYGYVILGYEPEGSTANAEPVLKSKWIDFLWATTRGYNLTDGLTRHLFSAFHRYGKLSSIECDIRPHTGKGEADERWRCKTPEETRSTFQKVIGNSFFCGASYHAVDFGKKTRWFNCPEALESMAKGIALWRRLYAEPPEWNNDVAVVMIEDQAWKQGHPIYQKSLRFSNQLSTFPLQTLNLSGYGYDLFELGDYVDSSRDYKAVILLNLYQITPERREALLKKIRKPGVTAIWNYAPGLLAEEGCGAGSMKKLTGIGLDFTTGQKGFAICLEDGRQIKPFAVPSDYTESPRVFCADPDAEKLGVYADGKTPALVRKRLPDGSVAVFSGLPVNDPGIWADLLKAAGCHAWTEPGFYVRSNSRLLQIFSGKNANVPPESRIMKGYLSQKGTVTVTLKKKAAKVTDCFTGEVVARDAKTFTLKADQPHTWLLEIE
ncbi:MAG: beta-galactosidase [Lentisphaeria bacterium]|nr:beta-galactosidase [Lentisphaeria bacterium]